jgi:hypothetical protein
VENGFRGQQLRKDAADSPDVCTQTIITLKKAKNLNPL